MKKVLLILCSVLVVLIIGLYVLNRVSESVIKKDDNYINELLAKNIQLGMTPDQLDLYFIGYDRQLSLWECPDQNMKNGECIGERALVVTIPLQSNFFWLGKGDAQIYFLINSENFLENYDYELYYPRFH